MSPLLTLRSRNGDPRAVDLCTWSHAQSPTSVIDYASPHSSIDPEGSLPLEGVADLPIRDGDGTLPHDLAAQRGYTEIVDFIGAAS